MESGSPRQWQYTWEAQSHIPILKLFLFSPNFNPLTQCKDLHVELKFEKSLLLVTWSEVQICVADTSPLQLFVPTPRVLLDLESPLNFRALDDHIEVKLALLLPVDHPIVSSFISELSSDEGIDGFSLDSDYLRPLEMDSDVKTFEAMGEVEFYCRNCSFKLTRRAIRTFVDMPSFNWREAADNWFGGCCCSFAGISDKLVDKYVKSYTCREGTGLLTTTSVILSKDDLVGCQFPEPVASPKVDVSNLCNTSKSCGKHAGSVYSSTESPLIHEPAEENTLKLENESDAARRKDETAVECGSKLFSASLALDSINASTDSCCHEHSSENPETDGFVDLLANQKMFLNGYLGNAFMLNLSTLSKELKWAEFPCPHCSYFLGAYPCSDDYGPLDGGIRLLKCCISSSLPVGSASDLFRKYALERMFSNQIMESAKDELSFHTVVKDLQTKSPSFQVAVVNPDSWCGTGYTSTGCVEGMPKINLQPVLKILFSDFHDDSNSKTRLMQDKESKIEAEEVFMFLHLIEDLVRVLKSRISTFPPSFSSKKGFVLTSIRR